MDVINLKDKKDISLLGIDKSVSFVISENDNASIFIDGLSDDNELNFDVKDGAYLHISFLADKPVKNLKILANVGQNAEIMIHFADFSTDENTANVVINLNKENARATWHLASLASEKDNKHISVSVFHNSPLTFARVDNYGVAKEESKLVFSGTSHILNGSIKSKTEQNAKIMVFDPTCFASANPYLFIDEYDVAASHAAAVGRMDEEHLYYLQSRGLTKRQAMQLITYGYLKPVIEIVDNENLKERFEAALTKVGA